MEHISPLWRTPNAYDGQQRHNEVATRKRLENGKTISLGMQMTVETGSGRLNPRWALTLMGFSADWLDFPFSPPRPARNSPGKRPE
jgi:hypothetical protein